MKRYCQTLDLKEDEQLIKEYCYWHSPEHIWPEIPEGIRAVGILNMEIYRLGTRLFMIVRRPMILIGMRRSPVWRRWISKRNGRTSWRSIRKPFREAPRRRNGS